MPELRRSFLALLLAVSVTGAAAIGIEAAPLHTPQQSGLVVVHVQSGPDVSTTSTSWVEMPQMKARFTTRATADLAITVCAEVDVTNNGRMFVRALVDGQPTAPSDVVLARGWIGDTRCFTFVRNAAPAGIHTTRIEWLTDAGSTAFAGDRTLHVTFAGSNADELALLAVAAPSGPDQVTTTTAWTDIPDMAGTISLPAAGDLAVSFSAEADTTANARLFVRALVDGQPCAPGDVVFVAGGFAGTRTFHFVKQGLAAGSHSVRLQWLIDPGAEGHVGDRTLTVTSVRSSGAIHAGRLMQAAPSGSPVSTTSASWADVPGLGGTIEVPVAGHLVIGFSAEVWASAGSLYLRALVDGAPASPSDVMVASDGFRGTYAYSFVERNVARGSHNVRVQWQGDGGNTVYLGDRALSAYAFARQQPLMVVAVESDRGEAGYPYGGYFADTVVDDVGGIRTFKPYVRDRLFGASPSLSDYLLENSGGRYFLADAGVFGPYLKQYDEKYYREQVPNPFDAMQIEALTRADAVYDFSLYDNDGNGTITRDELVTMVMLYQDSVAGFVRSLPNLTTNDGVVLDLSWAPHCYLPDFQSTGQLGLMLHELAHVFFDAGDMYENSVTLPATSGWDPTAPGPYSLMDNESQHPHLDPYHKLRAGGWFDPIAVTKDGYYDVPAVSGAPAIYKLMDPGSHAGEFFLVENRQQSGYEQYLPGSGLAIWHIDESRMPDYRAAVEMEPACGPTNPIQWHNYLWDGTGSLWGRDLWHDSTPLDARWHDGALSGIGVWAIPASGDPMRVYLDVPGPGILVDVKPESLTAAPGQTGVYQVRLVNTGQSADTFAMSTPGLAGAAVWSNQTVTLASYEQRIVTLTVSPASGGTGPVSFTVRGSSTSDPSVFTDHAATLVPGYAVYVPAALR